MIICKEKFAKLLRFGRKNDYGWNEDCEEHEPNRCPDIPDDTDVDAIVDGMAELTTLRQQLAASEERVKELDDELAEAVKIINTATEEIGFPTRQQMRIRTASAEYQAVAAEQSRDEALSDMAMVQEAVKAVQRERDGLKQLLQETSNNLHAYSQDNKHAEVTRLIKERDEARTERDEFKECYRLAMVSVNDAYDKGKLAAGRERIAAAAAKGE